MINSSNPIFKTRMFLDSIFIFDSVCIIYLFIAGFTILNIIIALAIGYFWFAYTIRILSVYEDRIKISFPLRFKPIYRKREVNIAYPEIEKAIFSNGRIETLYIILCQRRKYFGINRKDSFFFWPGFRSRRRNALLVFFKDKGVNVTVKPLDLTPDELK